MGQQNSSLTCAHFLSLWSGVTEDNVDSEHLHDDGAKRKRHAKSQKPLPSYAQPMDYRLAMCWDDKQHH
jgi:hypothetical protein